MSDLHTRQISFLQCVTGALTGAASAALVGSLWLAPQYLHDCHEDRRPSGQEVQPKLPVRQPMVPDSPSHLAQGGNDLKNLSRPWVLADEGHVPEGLSKPSKGVHWAEAITP